MRSQQPQLFERLTSLDLKRIHYRLLRKRPESVGIFVTLVRWRIEIFAFNDRHLEYSIFSGNEDVLSSKDDFLGLRAASA